MINTEKNPLNDYTSYSYNFKLYAVTKEDYNKIVLQSNLDDIHRMPLKKKAILAETGSTAMNITDVSITTRPTVTEGSYITSIDFDLLQIKGFSLVESIFAAGLICGWENLMQDPIFIFEISFKGILPDDSIETDLFILSLPVKFISVNTEVSDKGTKYNISSRMIYNTARSDITLMPEQISVGGVENFGNFITAFEESINEKLRSDADSEGVIAHEHHFVLDENPIDDNGTLLSDVTISRPSDENNPIHAASLENEGENGFTEYHFPPNMSIPKAIESVLATSTKIQSLLMDGNEEGIGSQFIIQPIVQFGKFNEATGDYKLIITWNITRQKIIVPTNNNISEEKYLRNLLKVGFLKKSYDYYYTGLNTEVLNADLKMSDVYFNKLAKYNNYFINKARNLPSSNVAAIPTTQDFLDAEIADRRSNNEPYSIAPRIEAETESEIFYVDDVKNLNFENARFFNKAIKEYSANSASEGTSLESGESDSNRYDYYLTLHNVRNNIPHSMLKLDLEIRGDIYWLIPAHNKYTASKISTISNNSMNMIGFFMGYPNEIQERNDEAISYRTDYIFSGIYMVTSVTSNFNGGRFTQRLQCSRIHDIGGFTAQREFGEPS